MQAPMKCDTRPEVWHRYLQNVSVGYALEFGVWNGRSINYMAEIRPRSTFVGFDSFDGLPEQWTPAHPVGFFKTDPTKLKWRSNVQIQAGLFDATLPVFLDKRDTDKPIQGIHIDCDLGSSTQTVLDGLTPLLLKDKPLLLFDEFYNYSGYEDHEFRAFLEWVNKTNARFSVLARNVKEKQVLIALI